MPQRVYNNVEDHRLIDNGRVVEDVTKVGLPTVKHPTSDFKNISGMVMDLSLPTETRVESMEFTVYHNNGINGKYLAAPGKHSIEVRVMRQSLSVVSGEIVHESVKFRIIGQHVETQKGDIESGSPYGSTEKYAVTRFEEEIEGEVVTCIDAIAGTLKMNGVDYTAVKSSILD